MTEEQWRVIEGYENYMVSNMGEVWSINTETKLRPGNNGAGYQFVYLYSDIGVQRAYVHRLVVRAFIGEIAEDLEVNHINHDRTDNRLSNLEIVSHSKNMNDLVSSNGYEFAFVESLPEDARPFERYGNYEFEDYFISGNQLFLFIREGRYRVLDVRYVLGNKYPRYLLKDTKHKQVQVLLSKLA